MYPPNQAGTLTLVQNQDLLIILDSCLHKNVNHELLCEKARDLMLFDTTIITRETLLFYFCYGQKVKNWSV